MHGMKEMLAVARRLAASVGRIGADPADSDEVRLQKALLVGASVMFILAGLLWGGVYIAFDERLAGSLPISYSAFTLLNILVLGLTHSYRLFRFIQLLLTLALPFFLQITLGGFVNSSAVILWSLICPLGALLFGERRHAAWWFLAFIGLLIVTSVVQPGLRLENNLPAMLILGFFVANIGTVSAIAFVLLYYFVGQEEKFMRLLRIEQQKSEHLLQNVLPAEIAAVLKDSHETIADAYESVSILFADIVGFTPLTRELSPTEMIRLLNELFTCFDSLVEKYGLEKIRTIGDSYMVVAGAPRAREDHAQAIARLALEMRTYIEGFRHGDRRIEFRIGISSGPVIAGVIGRQKFHYDVWGDVVNMASRMESTGVPGRIQITPDTYELVMEEFVCEPRGKIEVKGRGEMETWFLTGERATP